MLTMNIVGDPAFDAMRGGLPNDDQRSFFRGIYENAVSYLDDNRRAFVDRTRDVYRTLTNSQAESISKRIRAGFRGAYQTGIVELESIDDFQDCSKRMQRWMMAEPTIRQMAINGECEGYGLDLEKERASLDLDFRDVMNGVMVIPDEGKPYYDIHYDVYDDNRKSLNFNEQYLMIKMYNHAKRIFDEKGSDPTSQYGAELS